LPEYFTLKFPAGIRFYRFLPVPVILPAQVKIQVKLTNIKNDLIGMGSGWKPEALSFLGQKMTPYFPPEKKTFQQLTHPDLNSRGGFFRPFSYIAGLSPFKNLIYRC